MVDLNEKLNMIGSNILTRCSVHTTLFVLEVTKELNGPINYLGDVGLCNSCFCLLLVEVGFLFGPSCFQCVCVFFAIELIHLCSNKNCTITFSKGCGCRNKAYGWGPLLKTRGLE
jgi:hypothetical protein